MTYLLFKIIHFTGIFMIFLSFGCLIARAKLDPGETQLKKFGGLSIAVGLIMILFGGFGMLGAGRLPFGGWVIAKLLIWFIFGGLIAVANRKPEHGMSLWWGVVVLGATAAFLAIQKPF